ncbi:hypothetical protein QN277_022036 [Acacia crassicarpa]|uniref:Mediator complex subunit Med12 domain-containing protein n=1 Tax=Acacia crassicarpa TaxID=499986 RepID=A0AAE1JI98_9FABA|nr:hypothetical protein QN277_022036 [Acacia crassicarpa]
MQRYHTGSTTSAVSGSAPGRQSVRDTGRADSSSLLSNYSVSSRRQPQLNPYKLKCEKEPLNTRLGSPDFFPQTPNCSEETLTRGYVQSGYRETFEGLEEAREASLTQVSNFNNAVILNCKEAVKKCLRAINESRVQKRKAGQVYGVALSGSQLNRPGIFPEQRPAGEEFRNKWIEGLCQQHKRLRSLADHVPHGCRKKLLLEVLIKNNVPLLRATWFIKVTYLNQVRSGSASISSGVAADKAQLSRSENWTKDVVDYLQSLLDEFISKNASNPTHSSRDCSQQMHHAGSLQHRSDPVSSVSDNGEPSVYFKWRYAVRLLQWHHAEGLLLPSLVIDWVLNQLQEKASLETLQLLLPIIYGFLETVVLSQTYVHNLAGLVLQIICDPAPGGSDLVDNSRRAYTTCTLIEMLQYLIFAAPDTFVALDCFPLPSSVVSHSVNDGSFALKASKVERKIKCSSEDAACLFKSKGFDSQYQSLAFDHIISCIQKHAHHFAKATSSGYPSHCLARTIQSLDKSLVLGDVCGTYKLLFDDPCDGTVHEGWAAKVSPCLRLSLKWVGTVSLSFMHSVFFLCEWATCDFRDFRTAPPCNVKFTGRKDLSQVHIAVRLLKMKMRDMYVSPRQKNGSINRISKLAKSSNMQTSRHFMYTILKVKRNSKHVDSSSNSSLIFESPGPLHDIVVCWIDQHSVHKGEGLKRLNLFIVELIRAGIFNPLAYVRLLIVSGIMDMNVNLVDQERRKRHYQILKQLPGSFVHNTLEESGIVKGIQLVEALQIYLNERRLILRGLFSDQCDDAAATPSSLKQKHDWSAAKDGASTLLIDAHLKSNLSGDVASKTEKDDKDVEELKAAITVLLQLPDSLSDLCDSGLDESQGSVRTILSPYSKIDPVEVTLGCEECRRVKRQKISEERNSSVQGHSVVSSVGGDAWWMKKGMKSLESLNVDEPVKSTKQPTKNRHKTVHKTHSLAQLAAARIEGSQGASTSHVCDNKVTCPHHKTAKDEDMPKSVDGIQTIACDDVVSIAKNIKRLRFVEKGAIAVWLMDEVRQLIQAIEKNASQISQFGRPFAVADDRSTIWWKLGEDELSTILYLMDISDDLVSAVKFLLWLLPKVLNSPNFTIHSGRNVPVMPRNVDSQVCDVGEAFLLSSLRRYENILAAADLVPEALSAAMRRTAAVMASNGRISGSAAPAFARYLLKKYGNVASVIEWEKTFKATSDKRLSSMLDFGSSVDGELGFPLGVPKGVEDLDEFLRQKIAGGRSSRIGLGMRDIVQRNAEEALHYLVGKEKKPFAGAPKEPAIEKWDNGYQIAQRIVTGLIDCIRQTGGAAQEGDPSLVSYAVSVIVGSVGPTIAKIPDFSIGNNDSSTTLATTSLNYARCILRMHITCLCLLREALGERQSRVFEIALATEASTVLAGVFAPSKASRAQFQMSAEAHDAGISTSNDGVNKSSKVVFGRAMKIVAAVSALVVGAVIYGVSSLDRVVTVLRLKEGLDVAQFVRSTRSKSNGNARSVGGYKADSSIEVYVHWFRLLVGNCRTIYDGLVVELLGEPSIIALSRMQHMLPLSLVFPPAYSIFALVLWWPLILNSIVVAREGMNQLHQSLSVAMNDTIKHLPFRDVCLRDSQSLYDFMAADASDAEFATLLELNGSDMHFTSKAFVPLRARLFLDAMIECKMPQSVFPLDDGSNISGCGESKLQDKLVHVLDNLQPAKFHWQWVELRLLLNEQALVEKLEASDMSLADAIQLSSPNPEKPASASENENNFIAIILTRLLVRPDAASLFSELIHLFGRSLEDSMLLQAKWFLAGHGVLFGRKTIRQRLNNIAESKGLSVKAQYWEPWGWCNPCTELVANREKFDAASFEEGEVVEGGMGLKRRLKGFSQVIDQLHVTERALIELIIPCIDQSSDETRNLFASDLIKQLNSIEQQISAITRGVSKQAASTPKIEGQTNKVISRKTTRGGSPGLARRQTAATDSSPPSPAALRASLSLRVHLIMRFLPILCTDGEPSVRNMRHALASVILHLLGSRVVYEDAVLSVNPPRGSQLKREVESPSKASAGLVDTSVEGLFDHMLFVLHGLLSSCLPSWLRSPVFAKSTNDATRSISGSDQELLEILQNDLDHMQLPGSIRWRIQASMPALVPSKRCPLSCQPPSVPASALLLLQPRTAKPVSNSTSSNTRNPVLSSRTAATMSGKSKQLENDLEVDPWTLLEDGAGSSPSANNTAIVGSGNLVNLQAASWLRGAIRVRRTDLTYIGAVDDET